MNRFHLIYTINVKSKALADERKLITSADPFRSMHPWATGLLFFPRCVCMEVQEERKCHLRCGFKNRAPKVWF